MRPSFDQLREMIELAMDDGQDGDDSLWTFMRNAREGVNAWRNDSVLIGLPEEQYKLGMAWSPPQ